MIFIVAPNVEAAKRWAHLHLNLTSHSNKWKCVTDRVQMNGYVIETSVVLLIPGWENCSLMNDPRNFDYLKTFCSVKRWPLLEVK